MIIYLAQLAPDARVACAPRGATVPGDLGPEFLRGRVDRLSIPCFVLHRMGFFLPRGLLRAR